MTKKSILYLAALAMVACSPKANDQKNHEQYAADSANYATAMRGFYLWRCGTAVEGDYNGDHFSTDTCHMGDGLADYIGLPGQRVDGTGGWHDAGDYGKYTVNAGITVGNLFYAWDHFGDAIEEISLDIPDTAPGMPDFLKELKWETDFIQKMQYPDGSGRVSHKLTRKSFAPFIMPQDDKEDRYFTTWGSAATADFVAMMAMAAREFAPYDSAYAAQCLEAALVSYEFLVANPEDHAFEQGEFSTGGYQTTDPDDRLWAAAEIWETTGDKAALADVENRIVALGDSIVKDNWDWSDVANMGVWTYALSQREGRNPEIVGKVNQAIADDAAKIAARINADQYGCPLELFFWGCNGLAARNAVNLHVAEIVNGADYSAERRKIAEWLLGNNYYERSFVTGLGKNPPMHPHDRRCAADGIENPWPGYLVGGGHTATDWVDVEEDYSRNEIAINWQAGLVYVLASLLK